MSSFKQITCLLTQPVATEMIARLKEEKNIITANAAHARGTSSKSNYIMKATEILTVLVEEDKAEDVFYFLFTELKLDQPHQGMIYQEAISKSTKYTLPDIDDN